MRIVACVESEKCDEGENDDYSDDEACSKSHLFNVINDNGD